jgi:subtilisin-like proprotein convertase family protein
MSGNIIFVGAYSYSINPATNTVQLSAAELQNVGTSGSGTIRLELWLTSAPWNQYGSNTGYEIATDQLSGLSNGVLGSGEYFANIADTVTYKNHPPAGTYFITMAAAEYTGVTLGVDNGFVIDSAQTFPKFLVVGSDGSLQSSGQTPSVSIGSQYVVEGNDGARNMTFKLTLSNPVPYSASVQVDTTNETAVAGVDYLALHQTVTFSPGATSATVSVPIVGNTLFQPARAFEINLSNALGASIAPNYLDPTGTAQSFPQASAWGVIVDDDTPAGLALPTDTYFGLEWYLYATRVGFAWQHATGKGIKVAVFDQGIDSSNPELSASDNIALGRISLSLLPGGAPVTSNDNHGTHVAGIIAAAKDGTGVVGVAYDAQLVSLYTSDALSPQYLTEITNAFHYAASTDVLNNSWGFGNLLLSNTNWAFLDDAKNPLFAPAFQALHDLAANGRNGLGTVVVQSAGNAYNYGDDTNLHNFQNSRYIITVGATDYFGASSVFSTTGASILVSAPGGAGNRDFASILTTDRTGAAGDNASNYAFDDGTSFSSPIVAGIVALMLEVNPRLGYRDVQQILAYTAHQTDVGLGNWSTNGAHDWNGGGLVYNAIAQSSGFGQVDALAATRLAATWDSTPKTVANMVDVTASQTVNQVIPDNNRNGVSSTINTTSTLVVERVDVTVNITHPFIGDLEVALFSPMGTVSYLMYRPSQGNLSAVGSSQHDVHFTFDTVLDWGESARGNWTLNVRDLQSGDIGSFDSWSIDLIGHNASANHMFVYTNEYAQLVAADSARAVLSDPSGGVDTINASALGSDDRIDLSGATVSEIIGAHLTIAPGTTIQNAYGGDGNDVMIANATGSVLHGMAGNDTVSGGSGRDTLDGGAGNDLISGGPGIDVALYLGPRANYAVSQTVSGFAVRDQAGADGNDQLTQVERLKFSDTMVALDINGDGGQAFRIYQAAFDRTPDSTGLGYWIGQMDSGTSLLDVARGFVESTEFKALYGSNPENADIVTRFYSNVLHRVADAAGASYWTNLLDSHAVSSADVLVQFSESAENQAALIGVMQNGVAYTSYG